MPKSECRSCRHHISLHGDRAIDPACEGGYNGTDPPPTSFAYGWARRCECRGYS